MLELEWTETAEEAFRKLERQAQKAQTNRNAKKKTKSTPQEGLFKQVIKTVKFLQNDPRHPSLKTHPYYSFSHPWSSSEKVYEAYVQNHTAGAYRVFWCYGPTKQVITILAIPPHF